MNTVRRVLAGAELLLLAGVIAFRNLLYEFRELFRFKPRVLEHGEFRVTGIATTDAAKRAMAAAGLFAGAVACLVVVAFVHGTAAHLLACLFLGMGAAGTFASAAPANAPLPLYEFIGVYTGGTSDASPLTIAFATYNSVFAARVTALGTAPIPFVYVIQALANVTAGALTCSTTGLVFTFTSSGSALSGFIATMGAMIPSTKFQP